MDHNTVYVRDHDTEIYSYDANSDSWSQLPDCAHKNGSIAIISGWLTTVGGGFVATDTYFNELFSLTRKGSRWTEIFPPMPTKRQCTILVCTRSMLIVAGGKGSCRRALSTVEVMNTETHQWSTAADLPQPIHSASATVCGDQLYMLGSDKLHYHSKSVYTCSVSDLLQSCVSSQPQLPTSKRTNEVSILWRQIADLPVIRSTCVSCYGQLLAIGGYDSDSSKYSTAIYMYNSTANSWEIISHMTTGRRSCFTAVLPDNRLMVMGGRTDGYKLSDTVELASVCD